MENPKKNIRLVSNKNSRVILPNIMTLVGVCIGLTSIKFAFDGRFELSVIAVLIAAIIDGLDGRIARLIKATSKVGKELDSLTDVISFGVAPAFIMYFWALDNIGRFGWLISLIYVVCVALRLARFNVSTGGEPSWRDNFFEGIPSPAGGVLKVYISNKPKYKIIPNKRNIEVLLGTTILLKEYVGILLIKKAEW